MLTMNAVTWLLLLALRFMCVSSNEEQAYDKPCDQSVCETQTLRAPRGSSVLLQCNFTTSGNNWVTWKTRLNKELIRLSPDGRIKFLEPRNGRVKAFPNQASEGNYSIVIDELKHSDLGCYQCWHQDECLQVELSEETYRAGVQSGDMMLLIFICAGVTALILLSVGGYCCFKCIVHCNTKTEDYENTTVSTGASAPPVEVAGAPVGLQPIDPDNSNLVYENDDQYPASTDPTRNYCTPQEALQNPGGTQPSQSTSGIYPNLSEFTFERVESRRTKLRFHIELINRLRQASISRHFYVNQGELNKQQDMSNQEGNQHQARPGRKRNNENREYKNPIYNRSTDQLNHL